MSSAIEPSPWRLEWNENLSMNIPEIDAEHQNFILLVNKLNEAIVGRMDVEQIKYRMQAILDDAVNHFAHEEALFREWGYPAADEHAKRHAQVMHALHEIMGNFERGGVDYEWIEAGLKVKEALIMHLLHEDMKYRDYLHTSGVLPNAV
jgi:hemerythrin